VGGARYRGENLIGGGGTKFIFSYVKPLAQGKKDGGVGSKAGNLSEGLSTAWDTHKDEGSFVGIGRENK